MATGRHMHDGTVTRFGRDMLLRSVNGQGGAAILQRGIARNEYVEFYDDFLGDAGQALGRPGVYTETGGGGFTGDFISGAEAGVYRLLHGNANEAQSGRYDWGDTLQINMSKKPRMECRVRLNPNAAAFSADQRCVIGLASADNATLDSVVTNAWFRIEGANLNILAETDDGTTDDDDNDTGVDYVKNAWMVLEIEVVSLTQVEFRVDGVLVQTLSLAALAANTFVQPYINIQKDAGTETENLDIDYLHITWERG